jgi:hypothetical protein
MIKTTAFEVTCLVMLLSGCTSSMDALSRFEKDDRSITTGSVQLKAGSSDEAMVVNAVSSADLARKGSLPWANTSTGSAGVVETIREDSDQGRTCRVFRTTRHSYEGIAVFAGQTCSSSGGKWTLTAFDKLG